MICYIGIRLIASHKGMMKMGSPADIADLILKKRTPIVGLFYFDALVGPNLFTVYPQNLHETLKADHLLQNIASFMDVFRENDVFQVCMANEKINAVNLIFHIHSDWARGMQEVCMVSLLDVGCKNLIDLYGHSFNQFKDQLIHLEDGYKAFYAHSFSKLKTHPEIEDVAKHINALLEEFYKSLPGGT